MKIRPKNIIYAATGVKFTPSNMNGANWRTQVFNNYRLHLIDTLSKDTDDYGLWLNDMQARHAKIYDLANLSGDWLSTAYLNELVGLYQHDYKGDLRFGYYNPGEGYKTDFNQLGIVKAQKQNRYDVSGPRRTSGDYGNHDYKVDNLYSAITDDRRLLGRKGDWDENSDDFKNWLRDLNSKGWETYLDTTDNYYKLRRLPASPTNNPPQLDITPEGTPKTPEQGGVPVSHNPNIKKFDWNKINLGISAMLPNLIEAGRLAGSLYNNGRIYDAKLKGIRPNLSQTYLTHRLVVGDEATKYGYYRRAAQGLTKATRPFTADADRLMAYMMEARRVGDELRAQGDLADNAEIRRTSDESNQHQWRNTQRRTEFANNNIVQINYANAAKLDLLAQKYAADWSSWDNFLKSKEYRMRYLRAEDEAILKQIWALEDKEKIENDLKLNDLYKAANDAWTNNAPDKMEKIKAYKLRYAELNKLLLENYRTRRPSRIFFSASGMKITHKKKDDLLYKSARDVVEHFRKMSKMSDDSTQRSRSKNRFRLTPHPGGKTRRMQQGGVAPFTVFTPVALGGETSTQVSNTGASSSSKGSNEGKETLDLIKSLFLKVEGLPIDVNSVYRSMSDFLAKSQAFGTELNTNDIASMYLQSMQQLSEIKHSLTIFDKAQAAVTLNEALDEFAVDALGHYLVQDENGKISKEKTWLDVLDSGKNPITNALLLHLRAYSPDLAFGAGDSVILNTLYNGMGVNKIGAQIKALAGNLGSTESKIEGISKVESDNIKAGLSILANAPEGYYKITLLNKNQDKQVNAALAYIKNMLSPALRAILETHGGTDALIARFLSSQMSSESNVSISPLTGKAAKDANGNSKTTEGDIKSNFLVLILKDLIGVPRKFSMITREGNSELYSLNSKYISQLPNVTEDMSVDKMLGLSKVGSILDSGLGITFGDLVIAPENLKDIMFDKSGGATIVTLPCRWENGHKVVNFEIKDKFDEAVKEAGLIVPINYLDPKFNEILTLKLKEKNLNSLVIGDLLDPDMFGHFMVVSAYTTDKVKLKNFNSKYIEKVNNPDKSLEDRLIKGLSTNKDKNDYEVDIDDKWGWFEGTWDDVYRGSVFIPLNNDPISAQTGWGNDNIKLDEAQELATQYQTWNKMGKAKPTDSSLL